jgi:hypothetical protein
MNTAVDMVSLTAPVKRFNSGAIRRAALPKFAGVLV